MTWRRLIGALIPESPARRAGEQLGMAIGLQQLVRDLPTTTDTHPERED